MIFEGFKVMIIGMSVVFLFLYIIILMVELTSKIIFKFSHATQPTNNFMPETPKNNKGVIAAIISAALSKHISKGRDR